MGAVVSKVEGTPVENPDQAGGSWRQENRAEDGDSGGLRTARSGLDVLGSKNPDLQKSILNRQHSMSANSNSMP